MKANAFQKRINRKPAKNEHCLQAQLVKWCFGLGQPLIKDRFFAIPNGGKRNLITAAMMKAEGVRKGVPDLCFFREFSRVLFIEMKNGTSGKLSLDQKMFHIVLTANGFQVVTCHTIAEAIAAIQEFYRA